PSDLASLATESRRLYSGFISELEKASGLAVDYQECGALDLAYSQREWETLQTRAVRQAETGMQSKQVSTKDVAVFWPRVRTEGLVGAVFYPDDAFVNAPEVMVALAAVCQRTGVSIFQNCAVNAVRISDTEVMVKSERGAETFEAAVIAAGAW